MKILRTYSESATPREIYQLTRNPGVQKLSDMSNQLFHLGKWCQYDDGTEEKPKLILTMQEKETGVIYGTNSITFNNQFADLMDYARETEMEVKEIFILAQKSRNGRDFLQCHLPDENGEDGGNENEYSLSTLS